MAADLAVIITNYNKPPEQIDQCVESIVNQTVEPKEIILIDDGSDQPVLHQKAVTIRLPENMGVAQARDYGVKLTRRKLILFVDADDYLSLDFIQRCGEQIAKADIVFPNLVTFGGADRPRLQKNPRTLRANHLMDRKCTIPVTSMMHRDVYEKLGGFKELPMFEDWDFWIRAMAEGFTFRRADTLLYYRQSRGSRNHQPLSVKTEVYNQITAPYEVREGKIWVKNA